MQPLDEDLSEIVDAYTRARTPDVRSRDATWAAIERSLDAEAIAGGARSTRGSSRRWMAIGVVAALAAGVLLGLRLAPRGLDSADEAALPSAAYSRGHGEPSASRLVPVPADRPKAELGAEHVDQRSHSDIPASPVATDVRSSDSPPGTRPRAVRPRTRGHEGPDALREELELVRAAREAMTAGRPRRALELLAKHRRKFSRGVMREEARALEVAALCEVGPRARWRSALTRFDTHYPGSPLRAQLKDECAGLP